MNPYSPPGAPIDAYLDAPPMYAAASSDRVGEAAVELLRQTRPWVMLLSILAFAGSALLVVVGLVAVGLGMLMPGAKGIQTALGLVYLPMGFVYVYPAMKLWAFGTAIGRLVGSRSVADLDDALAQQKSFWKFSGIASVALMAVYLVVFVVAIGIGVAAGMGKV